MELDEAASAELPGDLAAALAGVPAAEAFFAALTALQRDQYVGWIEGARRPETRAARIDETLRLLSAGVRQRRRGTRAGGVAERLVTGGRPPRPSTGMPSPHRVQSRPRPGRGAGSVHPASDLGCRQEPG